MKFLLVLLAIWLRCSAEGCPNVSKHWSKDDLQLLCNKTIVARDDDMKNPIAFVKPKLHRVDLFSFSSPGRSPVDAFLTDVVNHETKAFALHTFPGKLRLGVAFNGTLRVDSHLKNDTTFRLIRPCDRRHYPYEVLCASRSDGRHYIVSLNSFVARGFRVPNCESSAQTRVDKHADLDDYLHHHMQYRENLYLNRGRCCFD